MKHMKFTVSVLALVMIAGAAGCGKRIGGEKELNAQPGTAQIIIDNGIEFEITTDWDRYRLGNKITVSVKATNISDEIIYISNGTSSFGASSVLYLNAGSEECGFGFNDDYKNRAVSKTVYSGTINPGEEIEKTRIFDTSDIDAEASPGDALITA